MSVSGKIQCTVPLALGGVPLVPTLRRARGLARAARLRRAAGECGAAREIARHTRAHATHRAARAARKS